MNGAALAQEPALRRILHVGCGGDSLPSWLPGAETRLDIDPEHGPDIVASMTALGQIGPFDVVYSAHALEHLYPHDVAVALAEFWRVLVSGGAVLMFVPDLEDARPTNDVLFISPDGPVTGFDLFYGKRSRVEETLYMAHHCGFTTATLRAALESAGFVGITVDRIGAFNLIGGGLKP